MEYGLIVTVLCLSIVFGLLCLLIGALYLMRFFSLRTDKKRGSSEVLPVVSETPFLIEENDDKIIAAITAAVQMIMSTKTEDKKARFIVRSIKRI